LPNTLLHEEKTDSQILIMVLVISRHIAEATCPVNRSHNPTPLKTSARQRMSLGFMV